MAFPKYFAMFAIPDEAKEEVRYFTKGMKKVRLLYFNKVRLASKPSFTDFADVQNYIPYLIVKEDGAKINVYTKENKTHIKEIVLDISSDNEAFIVALIGKMDKQTFGETLNKAKG